MAYDLEWDPETLELRLFGLWDGVLYRHFTSVGDFFEALFTGRYHTYRAYAHFGGRFDLVHLLMPLLRRGYRVEMIFSGSAVVRARVMRGRYYWDLCDSQFFFKTSLRELGKSVGLEKLECDFKAPLSILIPYNKRDCEILYTALVWAADLIESLGGELQFTLASTALALWRRKFLARDIRTMQTLNHTIRPAYVASRVEVIQRRADRGTCYDINSSFPYSMQGPLPGNLRTIDRRIGDLTIARVRVSVPDCFLPPLPVRHSGRVYFPHGTWEGWYTSVDLQILEECGGSIENVIEAYHFEPDESLGEYVETIYPLRLIEKDAFRRYFFKILLNALYGKFAEREDKERILINPPSTTCPHAGAHVDQSGTSLCIRMIRPGVFALRETNDVPHQHLPFSTYITSKSRALLWRAAVRVPELQYLDTDAHFSHCAQESSSALGHFKREYGYRDAHFLAPKAYALRVDSADWGAFGEIVSKKLRDQDGQSVKVKGFPRLTRDQFENLAHGEKVSFEHFNAVRTALRTRVEQRTVTKGFSTLCSACGMWVQDTCKQHGRDALMFQPRLRPKRAAEGEIMTRAWSHDELQAKYNPLEYI